MIRLVKGDKFNKLTFIKDIDDKRLYRRRVGLFMCDCGTLVERPISRVRSGYLISCGCMKSKNRHFANAGMRNTKEYKAWQSCLSRIRNKNNKDYDKYSKFNNDVEFMGNFLMFLNEIGPAPGDEYSVDRIDTTQGYRSGNIRWATRSEQQKNKPFSFNVEIEGMIFDSLQSAADYFHVTKQTISKWCYGYYDKRRNKYQEKKSCVKIIPKYQ